MITLPHTLGQHFAYALGRLGVLEAKLLRQTDIDRLLGAPTGEEALKMLRDIEFLAVAEGEEGFQATLNASMTLVKENVQKMAPVEKQFIFDILWAEGDRARIAYELKKENGFVSNIAVAPEPSFTAGLELSFDQKFATPQEIDAAVAKACDEHALALANRSGSKLIREYVEKVQELETLRAEMRTGDTELETIAFEQEGLAQIRELLHDMQKVTLGPEALFSYATRALGHIQLLKVLLTGKVNNLPIQEIKSLLPPLL